jgi:hypothetical protein
MRRDLRVRLRNAFIEAGYGRAPTSNEMDALMLSLELSVRQIVHDELNALTPESKVGASDTTGKGE